MSKWCSCTEELILHGEFPETEYDLAMPPPLSLKGLMPPIATCNEDLQSYIAKTR